MLTPEQLEERRQWIGASDVPAIVGISPYATPYDIFLNKCCGIYSEGNDATRLGSRLEPVILDWAETDYGLGKLDRNVRVTNEQDNREGFPLVVSLDARTGESIPVNAKTCGLTGADTSDYGEPETDEVPQYVWIQEQAEMMATGAAWAFVPCLIARRGFVMFRVQRDNEAISAIAERCKAFWNNHVLTGKPPAITDRPPNIELLKRIKREPGSVIDLPEHVAELWEVIEEHGKEAKHYEKAAQEDKATLIAMLGDHEAGRLPDGRLITYMETQNKGYTKVVEPFSYRTLRIKKG